VLSEKMGLGQISAFGRSPTELGIDNSSCYRSVADANSYKIFCAKSGERARMEL
jgi:hypothetical protein